MERISFDDYSQGGLAIGSVSCDNLRHLTVRQSADIEARILELDDIAMAISRQISSLRDDGLSVLDAVACIAGGELLPDSCYELHCSHLADNHARLSSYLGRLSRFDKAVLCDLLCSESCGIRLSEADFLPAALRAETFTYVKNGFSDEAYDVFTQDFNMPRVTYSKDFKSCCAAVSEGEVGYCLLPLEERGVRLPTVSELLLRYDLKINAVTPVFGFDGVADMKYALVSRGFTLPRHREGDDRYLELRLDGDANSLTELCIAAEQLGMSVYRTNTFTADHSSQLSVVIRDEVGNFTPLLLYLSLFVSDSTFVGIYKNLE